MRSDKLTVAFVLGAVALSQAIAQAPLNFDDRRTQLEAQTELVRKELELQEALRRLAAPGVGGMPSILAIMGIEGKLTARLLQPNGVVGTYAEGDVLKPGITIAAITPRTVVVRMGQGKAARAIPLDFQTGAATPGVPGLPQGLPGLTPVPPELLPPPPPVQIGPRLQPSSLQGKQLTEPAASQPSPAQTAAQPRQGPATPASVSAGGVKQ